MSNTPSPELVSHVNALVADEELTDEQVNRVIVAYLAVHSGEPVGTVVRQGSTLAQRIDQDGVHIWRVMNSDGSLTFDTRPTLEGWDVVSRPEVD